MAIQLSRELFRALGELRYEPTQKRVRALAGGQIVADTRRALLIWEPKRITPGYAVPEADVHATLTPAEGAGAEEHPEQLAAAGAPVLTPRTSFGAHTCAGEPLTVRVGDQVFAGAAFRLADLDGMIALDTAAFDWLEEDEPVIGHPHDPFSRIDVLRSSSRVQIEVDGMIVADSTAARVLFETNLPPRYYLPRSDVRMELLAPSELRTACTYKGRAKYFSLPGKENVAWSYEKPLADARDVGSYVCFFNERVDVIVDGVLAERPVTPWS